MKMHPPVSSAEINSRELKELATILAVACVPAPLFGVWEVFFKFLAIVVLWIAALETFIRPSSMAILVCAIGAVYTGTPWIMVLLLRDLTGTGSLDVVEALLRYPAVFLGFILFSTLAGHIWREEEHDGQGD